MRFKTKATVDSLKSIDVRGLKRKGFLIPGAFFALSWTKNGELTGSVCLSVEENRVILGQWFNSVQLTWTDCNYGGKRPWFICPGRDNSRSCGKRVAILYSEGRYFLCRHCNNLTYQSRNESESNRLMRKARKLRDRLGANHNLLSPIGSKPKHMHWETFETLQMEARLTGIRAFALGLAAIEKNTNAKT